MSDRGRRGDALRRAARRAGRSAWPHAEPRPERRRPSWRNRRRLPPRAGARAAQFPRGAAGLLVRPPGRDHRAEHLGLLQPGPPRPAPGPFYERGPRRRHARRAKQARELLECFWVKFNNQPAPPKVGVTAAESGTYTDFCNINTGGLKARRLGRRQRSHLPAAGRHRRDAPAAALVEPPARARRIPTASSSAASRSCARAGASLPSSTPTWWWRSCCARASRSKMRAPAAPAAAWRPGAFGKEAYILTGYFNLPKVLEITLNNGRRPRTGKQIGIETGDPRRVRSHSTSCSPPSAGSCATSSISRCAATTSSSACTRSICRRRSSPLLVDDCIANGRDYNDGGPRYNTTLHHGGGARHRAPTACRPSSYHVFDRGTAHHGRAAGSAGREFRGPREAAAAAVEQDAEVRQRRRVRRRHSARRSSTRSYDGVNGRPNTKGGAYRVNYLSTTCHVYFGSVTGATPDGRSAWEPLSRRHLAGAGRGPARAHGGDPLRRADGSRAHRRHAAQPEVHAAPGGRRRADWTHLAHLVRSYFKLDGHHIQFNVVTRRDAARSAGATPRSTAT